ncbi:hypothetical protein TcG_08725 [Trypanosoma cruzi]|nr:hypothetical protein TcG_08725 [Trypanosoma cruzi]
MTSLFVGQCRPIGDASGANGHLPLCRDPATLNGGCVGLHGRWEGDGVTDLIAFAQLCVNGCALFGTVFDRMPLRTTTKVRVSLCGTFTVFMEKIMVSRMVVCPWFLVP